MTWTFHRLAMERKAEPGFDVSLSLALSSCISLIAALIFALTYSDCRHWFLFPVAACGAIIGQDAVDWVRGRYSLLDPVGLIGLFGIHFFLLSPLLMVAWDYRMSYLPTQPDDYRPWLGAMGILNAAGLLAYRQTRGAFRRAYPANRCWALDLKLFPLILGAALLVSAAVQIAIYIQVGGVAGYLGMVDSILDGHAEIYAGLGWKFCLAEAFPIIALLGMTVYFPHRKGGTALGVMLAALLLLTIACGGLRGSRTNIIWPLFWAMGLVHLYIRTIRRSLLLAAIPLFGFFMYVYGFYKAVGPTRLDLSHTSLASGQLSDETGRTGALLLLSDLGRSDVQAFALFKTMQSESDYRLAFGQTYLGAFALLIPKSLWPERPINKVKWTTEAEYGRGTYAGLSFYSSRVYGLGGEIILNFGPLAIPFAYAAFGILVGSISRGVRSLDPSDSRLLLAPFGSLLCLLVLLNDSDVVLTSILKYAAMPLVIVVLSSAKNQPASGLHPGEVYE